METEENTGKLVLIRITKETYDWLADEQERLRKLDKHKKKVAYADILQDVLAMLDRVEDTAQLLKLLTMQRAITRLLKNARKEALEKIKNGRYLLLQLTPGEHWISDKNPDNRITFDVVSGHTYYIFSALVNSATGEGDLRRLLSD